MPRKTVVLKGVAHGKAIELERDTGLPDGQEVSVTIRASIPTNQGPYRAFGAWADDAEGLDEFIAKIREDRKHSQVDA